MDYRPDSIVHRFGHMSSEGSSLEPSNKVLRAILLPDAHMWGGPVSFACAAVACACNLFAQLRVALDYPRFPPHLPVTSNECLQSMIAGYGVNDLRLILAFKRSEHQTLCWWLLIAVRQFSGIPGVILLSAAHAVLANWPPALPSFYGCRALLTGL